MSTPENGIPQNIKTALSSQVAVNIASSTNANPIQITTSTNHLLTTGDWVDVEGHLVNTAANGIWPVTVTSASQYTIPTTGNGVGAATGVSQSLALGPTFAIPADGVDNESAASVNVPFQALADRTSFLGLMTGGNKVVTIYDATTGTITAAGNVAVFTNVGAAWQAANSPFAILIPGVQGNDTIQVNITTTAKVAISGTDYSSAYFLFGILYSLVPLGGSPTYQYAAGSGCYVPQASASGFTIRCGLNLSAQIIIPVIPLGGDGLSITLGAYYLLGSAPLTVDAIGDLTITATQYRPTGMPQ